MVPLHLLPASVAEKIQVVFTDIDDTLTTEGRLPAEAYSALWQLKSMGIAVVPVTGRPAGWCDHFARMWPIEGIVGENGAFYFRYDEKAKKLHQRFHLSDETRAKLQDTLATIGKRILKEVPGSALASDQPYRIHDLAVDFCEDVPPLTKSEIDKIVAIFADEGATAKVSSIHVNGWFGDYDKLTTIKTISEEVLGLDLSQESDRMRCIYAGDSPNDEPAFGFFENAVGVANILEFKDQLQDPPKYITEAKGGEGFSEMVQLLATLRGQPS